MSTQHRRNLICIAPFLISLATIACAGDAGPKGEQGEDGEQGEQGTKGEDGSSCTVKDNDDGTKTLSCEDGTSVTIRDGKDGAEGATGANGKDGSDAKATEIIERFYCGGALERTSPPHLKFSYEAVLFSSGDLFVTATVGGTGDWATGTSFYAPEQDGYKIAAVTVPDVDGSIDGGGFIVSLARDTLVTVINYYFDSSTVTTPTNTWTMQPGACVHNFYNQTGT
jgi:hypothetical protein